MEECLTESNQWSRISQKMKFRNEHQVKNRFFSIIQRELGIKRDKVRELIQKNGLKGMVPLVLKELKTKSTKYKFHEKNQKNDDFIKCNPDCLEGKFSVDAFLNLQATFADTFVFDFH